MMNTDFNQALRAQLIHSAQRDLVREHSVLCRAAVAVRRRSNVNVSA